MAKFLNTSKTLAEISDLAFKAQNTLVLISPFIQMPAELMERLHYVAGKGTKITVVCRGKDIKPEEKSALKLIRNLELRFLDTLHAKCFYNEETMVITSLNLYEYSSRNREMGILLTAKDDGVVFAEAICEAEFVVKSAEIDATSAVKTAEFHQPAKQSVRSNARYQKQEASKPNPLLNDIVGLFFGKSDGYCIRCHNKIEADLSRPLCKECWTDSRAPSKTEAYCHACGNRAKTTMVKPLCLSCFKNSG